jgi:hypothetical protein
VFRQLFLVIVVYLYLPGVSVADEDIKIIGMPSLAFNSGNTFVNFGGPSLKMESGDYFGGLSFFPSLRHSSSANEWSPLLGAGVYAGRKNIFVILPSYYYTSTWYAAVGLGYKF